MTAHFLLFKSQLWSNMGSNAIFRHRKSLINVVFARLFAWLGWQDLNLRMPESKSGALPLGDTPILYAQKHTHNIIINFEPEVKLFLILALAKRLD